MESFDSASPSSLTEKLSKNTVLSWIEAPLKLFFLSTLQVYTHFSLHTLAITQLFLKRVQQLFCNAISFIV